MDTAEATAINPSLTSDHDLRVSCYCEENAWRVVYRHLHHLSYSEKTTNNNNNNNDDDDVANNNNNNNNKKKKKYAYYVVFISNEQRCVPFFRQRAKPENSPSEYVCWDYHVIVLRTTTTEDYDDGCTYSEILDIDTWLRPYPCPIDEYINGSFPHANNNYKNCNNNPQYLPCFRVIPAEEYLKYFYSDRRHMYKDGEWLAPPPSYGCIMNGLSSLADNGGSADATKQKSGKECKGDDSKQSNLEVYIDMKKQKEEQFGKVYTLEQFRATFCSRR